MARSVTPPARLFSILAALLLVGAAWAPPARAQTRPGPYELKGFVVTGTPVARSASAVGSYVTVLEGVGLRSRGVTRVTDALRAVPGLVVVESGSYGSVTSVFFRGSESDHTKVLIDGVAVNQAGGSFDFSGLQMANVERIEIVRGPASALYGSDAMAGVIHVITRRGAAGASGSVSVKGGTFGRLDWKTDIHGGSDRTSYGFALSRLSSDGILEFNNQHESTTLEGSVQHRADEQTWLSLSGRYSDRTFNFPTDGSGNLVDDNQFTFGDEVSLGLDATRLLGDRFELKGMARLYDWDGGTDDQPDSPADTLGFYAFSSLDDFRRASVEVQGNLDIQSLAVLSAGVELEDMEQRSFSEYASEYGPGSSQSRSDRTNVGYYAHLMGERRGLAGNAGIRLEDNEQYGTFVTYQLGLSYALTDSGTRFRGTLGSGLKEPTFFEAYATGFTTGNPDLRPEKSLVWDLGVEQTLGSSGASISLSWFDQTFEDLIQYTGSPPEPTAPNFYNVAKASSRGLETEVQVPLGPLYLGGGYTYLDTKVLDSGFDEGEGATFVEGEALLRRPSHQLSLEAGWRFDRGTLSADGRYVGSRSDRDFGAWPAAPVELAAYTVLNLGADVRLADAAGGRPGFTLQLRAENLLDEGYEEVFNFRAPGRAFILGGRMDFGVSSPW